MKDGRLEDERQHLAELIEAIQRCAFFLDASIRRAPWPPTKPYLEKNKKDEPLAKVC